ncbi:MAG: asparagine synthase-related protein [Gemmatimonadota bacterium]
MTTKLDDFLAWVPPADLPADSRWAEYRRQSGLDPTLEVTGLGTTGGAATGRAALLTCGSRCSTGRDPSAQITLVLFGDPLGVGADPAADLATRYATLGEDFARDVHGSWTAIVTDARQGRILAFTDRLNSRRLFHTEASGGGHWLSPDLRHIPKHGLAVDPIGVAWFLSNGAIHCGRTPYAGVSVLEAASAHELGPFGLESRQYWQYPFAPDESGGDEKRLGDELVQLLQAGVERCSRNTDNVWLSLSGGYDSRTISAMLERAGTRDVTCFSYSHGQPTAGTDAWVAYQIAEQVHYSHQVIESYRGDLAAHIKHNARMGQGVAPVCDEIDGWLELGKRVETAAHDGAPPVLLVGDHYLPDSPGGPHKESPPGRVRRFGVVEWLSARLPSDTYRAFHDGVESDLDSLCEGIARAASRIDNFLYLGQRVPNVLLPWRHAFAGPYFNVRTPFLDNDVMDFLATVPGPVERSTFYHDAIVRTFPGVFSLPFATAAGYCPQFVNEFARNADRCRRLIRERPSRLDDVVSPDVGLGLVDWVERTRSLPARLKRRVSGMLGLGGKPSGAGAEQSKKPERAGETVVLRRYLVLREALADNR